MWSNLIGENLEDTKELREIAVAFFSSPNGKKFLSYLLNRFFRWQGQLAGDRDVHLHNAAMEFIDFLRGRDPENYVDDAFQDELTAVLDSVGKMNPEPSGKSEGWRDARTRRKDK